MKIRALIISSITSNAPAIPDAELVSGLHAAGMEIDVMIPPNSAFVSRFEEHGIRVIPHHPRRKFSIRSILVIRNEIRQRKYHIIHLFNTKAIVNGCFAAVGLPVKVIAYRGAAGIYWYDPTAWLSHLNPRIDFLVCNSWYVWRHLQKQLLFRPGKAVMIHKGMDPGWFRNIMPIHRQDLGVPDNAIVVCCVANIRRIKGVDFLLGATHHLNPELPVHIVLIGTGMDSPRYLQLIESSPFRNRIHILGYRQDVYQIVAACDIYVQPSLSESLSRSVMEAMCLGVPCIVSDVGGLIELIDHEKCGLVVQKASVHALARAIETLAADPALRQSLATEAVKRMKNSFSVENMVINTRKLYEKAVR